MNNTTEICSICCENYDTKTHIVIKCMYCEFEACSKCCQTYLLSEDKPSCMNTQCDKEWTRKFLRNHFKNNFLTKDYKTHRENIIFNQERALLPATQPLAEDRKQRENQKNEINNRLNHLILRKKQFENNMNNELDLVKNQYRNYIICNTERIDNTRIIKSRYNRIFNNPSDEYDGHSLIGLITYLRDELHYINNPQVQRRGQHIVANTVETPVETPVETRFVRQCPAEGCRGFLSTRWKCGLCEKWACSECHEVKGNTHDAPHTCNPDSVASAKLLAKDSKPCPKCQSLIFKIDGCDQMWCTQCHTAFSWKTGKLETRVHNPHYFEWMRQQNNGVVPRNPDDIPHNPNANIEPFNPCGNNINSDNLLKYARIHGIGIRQNDYTIYDYYNRQPRNNYTDSLRFENIQYKEQYSYCNKLHNLHDEIRHIIHIQQVTLNEARFRLNHFEKDQDLRIKYLLNEITEDTFKTYIQRSDKEYSKRREIVDVLDLYINASTDIINRIINDFRTSAIEEHHFEDIIIEFYRLRDYCNDLLHDISKVYNCVRYAITPENGFITIH